MIRALVDRRQARRAEEAVGYGGPARLITAPGGCRGAGKASGSAPAPTRFDAG